MSVLVRGMKMPRVCAECFMDPPCCEALSGDINIWKERHPNCPLVEVKEPHGRLIDAEELKKDLTRFYENEVTARHLIDEQPTIIEAEGSDT